MAHDTLVKIYPQTMKLDIVKNEIHFRKDVDSDSGDQPVGCFFSALAKDTSRDKHHSPIWECLS